MSSEGMKATTLTEGESLIGSMVPISESQNDEDASSPPVSGELQLDITPEASFAEEKSWDEGHQVADEVGDSLPTTGKEKVDRITFSNPLHQPSRQIDLPPGSRDSLVEPTWNSSTEDSVLETPGVNFETQSHSTTTTTTRPPTVEDSYPLDSSNMPSSWSPSVTAATVRSGRYPSLGDDAIFQKLHDSERMLNESSPQNLLNPPSIEEKKESLTTTRERESSLVNDVVKTILEGQLSDPTESMDESETYYSVTQSEPCSPSTAATRTSPKRSYAEWRQMVKGRPSPTARAAARKFSNSPSSSTGDLFPSIKLPFETNSVGDVNTTGTTDVDSPAANKMSSAEISSGKLVPIAVPENKNLSPPVGSNPPDNLIASLEKLLEDENPSTGAEQLSSHDLKTSEASSNNVIPGDEMFDSNTNATTANELRPNELSSVETPSPNVISSLENPSEATDSVAIIDNVSSSTETDVATSLSSNAFLTVKTPSLTSVAIEPNVAVSSMNTDQLPSTASNPTPSSKISNVEPSISNHVESAALLALSQPTPGLETATTTEERSSGELQRSIQALCLGVPVSQHVEESSISVQHVEMTTLAKDGEATASTFAEPAVNTTHNIATDDIVLLETVPSSLPRAPLSPEAAGDASTTQLQDEDMVALSETVSAAANSMASATLDHGELSKQERQDCMISSLQLDNQSLTGEATAAPGDDLVINSDTFEKCQAQDLAVLSTSGATTVNDEPDLLGARLDDATASTLIDTDTKSQAQEFAVLSTSGTATGTDEPDLLGARSEVEHSNNPIVSAFEKECQDPTRSSDLTQTEPPGNAFVTPQLGNENPSEASPLPREASVQDQVVTSSLSRRTEDGRTTVSILAETIIDSKPEELAMETQMAMASMPGGPNATDSMKEPSLQSGSFIDSFEDRSFPVPVNQTAPIDFTTAAASATPFEGVEDHGVTESSQSALHGMSQIPGLSLISKTQLIDSLDLREGDNAGDRSQTEAAPPKTIDLRAVPKADDHHESPAFSHEDTGRSFLASETVTLNDRHEVDSTTIKGADVDSSQVSSNQFLPPPSGGMSEQLAEFGTQYLHQGRGSNDFQPEFGLSGSQFSAGHDHSDFGQAKGHRDHRGFAFETLDNNSENIPSLTGGPTAIASNSSYAEELPNPLSQESMTTTTMGTDPWRDLDESMVIGATSSTSPGKPFSETGFMVQNSLGTFDHADSSVHESMLSGLGVIGKPIHPSESLSTQPAQPRQNERSDTIPLSFVPPYAIVAAQAQEIQTNANAKLQQDSRNQFSESVGASADSYFSYQVAEQPQNVVVALPRQVASSQRLHPRDGMDLGEHSFGPAPSHRTTDAFAQVQPGESFGYSYESAKNSPLAEDDAPPPISQGWLPPVHDNKVGNVILVPRPGKMDGLVNYTAPPQQISNPYHPYPALALPQVATGAGGRRKIKLKLQEDVKHQDVTRRSFFFRKKSVSGFGRESIAMGPVEASVDRGTITVSWYDGTTSLELQEHVRRSVIRKLGIDGNTRLRDIRILDESVDPPEEIVLSPFIPDGSRFLLRFSTKDEHETRDQGPQNDRWSERAPESPGASPSPYPSSQDLAGLNATQLALLASRWNPLTNPNLAGNGAHPVSFPAGILKNGSSSGAQTSPEVEDVAEKALALPKYDKVESKTNVDEGDASSKVSVADTDDDILSMQPDDVIEERLRKITELLLLDRRRRYSRRRQEKRQVIFVLANYFVLFLSLIAISAEIQARAPNWLAYLERELASVQQCATDQDALFNCVSNGDFAGLIASVILWLSRSASTKRIFLFGFKSPKQLWTVVYEALVTGVCWGFSYLFIRRAMNPETRKNYFQKYWKDAVYGSLAGFNAAFMKHVLKNLIPQERFEEALQQKQLNIFSWFPSVIKK